MWGFLWGVLEEHNSHIPVADQFADSWLPVLLTILSISMATILPKLVSGVSLKTLMETATGDNLDGGSGGQILRYFDATNELLIGRVAMMGFSGLVSEDTHTHTHTHSHTIFVRPPKSPLAGTKTVRVARENS
jgi:hypothetical protein